MNLPLATLCLLLTFPAEWCGVDRGETPEANHRLIALQLAQAPIEIAPNAEDAEQQRRQNTVTVGVMILVGVAAIGLLLIAAALIWGAKVRRMVRPTDPQPTRQDDLWYLRKGKPPADAPAAPIGDEMPPARPRISDSDDTRS